MITLEDRNNALAKASDMQKYLFSTPESGRKLRFIANKFKISNPEDYFNFSLLIGDLILDLISKDTFKKEFREKINLDNVSFDIFFSDIELFLQNKDVSESDNYTKTGVIPTESALGESTSETIPRIRTMAQDMSNSKNDDEVVYSTTQAAILNESKPKTEATNSWGSETK